jgi:hypothetical protein
MRNDMKRWFSLLLLTGALLGLFGQAAAFAHVTPIEKSQLTFSAPHMSAECDKMMGLAKQAPYSKMPRQGMTPDCAAQMGCTLAVALLPPLAFSASLQIRLGASTVMAIAPLIGRDTGPEPEPPTLLV